MSKDYYQTLGVSKNASADEIKKAFRKLAHQHHPDKKGGDDKHFKEINEAHQVLSDPDKRAKYDQFGPGFEQAGAQGASWQDFSGQGGFSGQGFQFDMGDLGDVFGEMFGFGGGKQKRSHTVRGSDLQIGIEIELRDAIFGTKKELRISKKSRCKHCSASGAEPGTKVTTCSTCNGTGQVVGTKRTILGVIQTATPCSACNGTGQHIEKKCKECRGEGRTQKDENLAVSIPAGIDDGGTLRLSGEGEAGVHGGSGGDLYVRVHVREDKKFHRQGADLITDLAVHYSQCVLGDTIPLETFDGRMEIKIPVGIQSGQLIRLAGLGVPYLHKKGRGDLLVRTTLITPKSVSRKQRELLEQLKKEGL